MSPFVCVFSLIQDGTDRGPSSSTSLVLDPGRFDFEVSDCFLLGCPLGLVLAMRRTVLPAVQGWCGNSPINVQDTMSSEYIPVMFSPSSVVFTIHFVIFIFSVYPAVSQLRPACSQIVNLFYPSDPSASRLEPLLHSQFHKLPPFLVPRYQRYPLGDGRSSLIGEWEINYTVDC